MAKDIKIAGATYKDVPSIVVPEATGGEATFYDCTGQLQITENGEYDVTGYASVDVQCGADPILEDKIFYWNGDYTPSQGYDGFNSVAVRAGRRPHRSVYADIDGKFIKPDEWDDIESQPLDGVSSELWLLYDNTIDESWACFKATTSTGTYKVDAGRIANGVFNIIDSTELKTNVNFYCDISTTYPNEDYIVFHVYNSVATANITSFAAQNWTYNGTSHTGALQPILMRYGCLPYVKTLAIWGTQYLISDNIINLKSINTLYAYLNGCYRLVRHRHTGWDTKAVTNAANMFANCYVLTDIDRDFSGWFSNGVLTTTATMFVSCNSLIGDIDVTGWNMTNVTTIAGMFYGCYNITKLIGIEGWYLPQCYILHNSSNGTFHNCNCLYQNDECYLDLSNWRVGELSTNTTAKSCVSLFNSCMALKKINLSGWNLDRCASLASMFNLCLSLEEVVFPESIGTVSPPTTMASMFTQCSALRRIVMPRIDVSAVTTIASMFATCWGVEEIDCSNIIGNPLGGTANSLVTSICSACYQIRKVDFSFIDCLKFTYSASQLTNMLQYCYMLEEIYPHQNINKNYTIDASPHLSHDSIMRIINNLVKVTTATTLKVGAVNLAKISDAEKAIATGKGWTLA